MARASQDFATRGEVTTIDILPLDLQLWSEPGYEVDLDKVRAGAEVNVMGVAIDTLARRNYGVGAMIDWNGDFPGGHALAREDLIATVSSLSRYGAVVAAQPDRLPPPFLPVRLGTATGADATLYVGGWGYVARHRESTGEQVVTAIGIGVLIISVVAIIALIASSKSSRSRGGERGGSRHAGGHIPSGAGRGAGGATRGVFTASRGAGHVRHASRAVGDVVDAFGRAAIDIALTPDWAENAALPREGSESQMYLEMTLVDNRTGFALWHAHQSFPASAASAGDTARAARTMMGLLPARAHQAMP